MGYFHTYLIEVEGRVNPLDLEREGLIGAIRTVAYLTSAKVLENA